MIEDEDLAWYDSKSPSYAFLPTIEPNVAACVPKCVLRTYSSACPLPCPERGRSDTLRGGVIMIVDICKFSPIVMGLAAKGAQGLETLAATMFLCFTAQLKIVNEFDGDCIKFAGDALIILFQDSEQRDVVQRAVCCALTMIQEFQDFHVHEISIDIHVAIGYGDIQALHIGGVENQYEFLLAGQPFKQLQVLIDLCHAGELAISKEAWTKIQRICDCEVREKNGETAIIIHSIFWTPSKNRYPKKYDFSLNALAKIEAYVPIPVLSKIENNVRDMMAEYREACILFVNLSGLDLTQDNISVEMLNSIFVSVQYIVQHNEGYCRQFLVDDKGTVLIIAFGVHGFSQIDNCGSAIRTALQIRVDLEKRKIRATFGISSGQIYSGMVGTSDRQEFLVMGKPVISAARLSCWKDGKTFAVMCDEGTVDRIQDSHIQCDFVCELKMKGLNNPQKIYAASLLSESSIANYDCFGREVQIRQAEDFFSKFGSDVCFNKREQMLLICGERGSGKSIFLKKICEKFIQPSDQFVVIRQLCSINDSLETLGVWKKLVLVFLREYSKLLLEGSISEAISKICFGKYSKDDIELIKHGLEVIQSEEESSVKLLEKVNNHSTSEFEQEALVYILQQGMNILSASDKVKYLIFILEDIQNMDRASLEFSSSLLGHYNSKPIIVVATLADDTSIISPEYLACLQSGNNLLFSSIELPFFSETQTVKFACLLLNSRFLSTNLQDFIYNISSGSPVWIHDVIKYLSLHGLVQKKSKHAYLANSHSKSELPLWISNFVMFKMEQLTETQQLILKLAAAIGDSFTPIFLLWICKGFPKLQNACEEKNLEMNLNTIHRLGYLSLSCHRQKLESTPSVKGTLIPQEEQSGNPHFCPIVEVLNVSGLTKDRSEFFQREFFFKQEMFRATLSNLLLPEHKRCVYLLLIELFESQSIDIIRKNSIRLANCCLHLKQYVKAATYFQIATEDALVVENALHALFCCNKIKEIYSLEPNLCRLYIESMSITDLAVKEIEVYWLYLRIDSKQRLSLDCFEDLNYAKKLLQISSYHKTGIFSHSMLKKVPPVFFTKPQNTQNNRLYNDHRRTDGKRSLFCRNWSPAHLHLSILSLSTQVTYALQLVKKIEARHRSVVSLAIMTFNVYVKEMSTIHIQSLLFSLNFLKIMLLIRQEESKGVAMEINIQHLLASNPEMPDWSNSIMICEIGSLMSDKLMWHFEKMIEYVHHLRVNNLPCLHSSEMFLAHMYLFFGCENLFEALLLICRDLKSSSESKNRSFANLLFLLLMPYDKSSAQLLSPEETDAIILCGIKNSDHYCGLPSMLITYCCLADYFSSSSNQMHSKKYADLALDCLSDVCAVQVKDKYAVLPIFRIAIYMQHILFAYFGYFVNQFYRDLSAMRVLIIKRDTTKDLIRRLHSLADSAELFFHKRLNKYTTAFSFLFSGFLDYMLLELSKRPKQTKLKEAEEKIKMAIDCCREAGLLWTEAKACFAISQLQQSQDNAFEERANRLFESFGAK